MTSRIQTKNDKTSNGPRFCPRCRKAALADLSICRDCGETLLDRGYCEVCDAWLLQPIGTECPKHDLPLIDAPPTPDLDLRAISARFVTVATYGVTSAAQGPRLRLEAEGIPVFLEGERMGADAIYQVATGGVKLQVPEDQAAEARILLSQRWAPVDDGEPDDDDPWEGLEPPHPAERRRSVMKGMILFYLFWPSLVALVIAVCSFLAGILS